MRLMEPIVAAVSYMVLPGNHEDDGENFLQIRFRFNNNDPDRANQYYSFNLGPIHFIGVSTELMTFCRKYGDSGALAQHKWLTNDLKVIDCWRICFLICEIEPNSNLSSQAFLQSRRKCLKIFQFLRSDQSSKGLDIKYFI